jgi:hypothetical protein
MTATAERATITKPTDREIRVGRTFDASRDRVWDDLGDGRTKVVSTSLFSSWS